MKFERRSLSNIESMSAQTQLAEHADKGCKYEASWNSLKMHKTPSWFQNAKFGIYTHWGIYSVPACRPNGSWYGFYMYQEGSPQYKHHVEKYGHPSKFGYKDFIPQFTGEKFNAEEWAELFQKAGARFAGPVGEHHDGFSMWDTSLNRWNAKKMGPKADVVGQMEKAIRERGMKYMVALHHAENWRFFPHWVEGTDLSNPQYYDLYGTPHDLDWKNGVPERGEWPIWNAQTKPDKAFCDQWLYKCKEIIDRFTPDMLWFDFGLGFMPEEYRKEMLAYYYNESARRGQEVVTTYKFHDLAAGSGVIDLELGRFDKMMYHDWITDTTVDDGEGWCYLFDAQYKKPGELIHYLIDNVSKNGYLLLNVGPKPNGEIPEEAVHILLEMGKWLGVNGEAIYDTTPWVKFGEGPSEMKKSGMFSEDEKLLYGPEDIRFTVKENVLYASVLGWPEDGKILIRSASALYPEEIGEITMLGDGQCLKWNYTEEGLLVRLPEKKPCDYAWVLKITRRSPF